MPPLNPPPRLHILPASAAPIAVILRRKPSRLYHVMLWRTDQDAIEPGSWFRGRLYERACDLAPDGQWMTYVARGANGFDVWNAVCRPPWLRAAACQHDPGLLFTTAWFHDETRIDGYCWGESPTSDFTAQERESLPRIVPYSRQSVHPTEPLLTRVGFTWREQTDPTRPHWLCQPTPKHPAIRLFNPRSTRGRGLIEIDTLNLTLDPRSDWACYDSRNQLLIARQGRVERWSLRDIKAGSPGFTHDLANLEPPPRTPRGTSPDTDPTTTKS